MYLGLANKCSTLANIYPRSANKCSTLANIYPKLANKIQVIYQTDSISAELEKGLSF